VYAQKMGKIGRVVPEICSRTDRQTNRQTDRQTGGGVIIIISVAEKSESRRPFITLSLYSILLFNKGRL